ncbi:hypothetical protein [Roseivivax sediminis]|uniref:DUF1127 domain-containing protein n=1 Tax=Roseivivax sediminis TaxID=936889 RepID=A0A1I1VB98_9RHOB|nr:hypothetical protein [Roseivivax sediminis]SFD80371.1 hypothetical protein SAMN04515678_103111 [Roseivivax sediminis]
MSSALHGFTTRLGKRAAYRRTLRELRALPLDTRLDLDIAGAEKSVARRAVYG